MYTHLIIQCRILNVAFSVFTPKSPKWDLRKALYTVTPL